MLADCPAVKKVKGTPVQQLPYGNEDCRRRGK